MIPHMESCRGSSTDGTFLLGAAIVSPEARSTDDVDCRGIRISKALRARILAQRRASVIRLIHEKVFGDVGQEATACMVLPWYKREHLDSYLVLFAGAGPGTFEVWAEEQQAESVLPLQLRLSAGYFGELQGFLRASVGTRFCWGEGLPGRAAARCDCVVFPILDDASGFLRAEAAKTVGLQCGFAVPVSYPNGTEIGTVLLGQRDVQCCRIDTWSSGEQISRVEAEAMDNGSTAQLMLATRLAEAMSKSGKPEVLFEESEARFAFGWIARGFTSIPRMLTVVT